MRCNKCGTDNPKGKSICRKCSAFLYSAYPDNRVPLTPEQKRKRRISLFKGTASGCFWSIMLMIGLFLVLGVISWLLVRFVLPEDYFPQPTGSDYTSVSSGAESISDSGITASLPASSS